MGYRGLGLTGMLVLAPGEPGLKAHVVLSDDRLVIETSDGEHEGWDRADVQIEPYDTRTTVLMLGDSRLFFHADQPLEFADALAGFIATPPRRRRSSSRRKSARRGECAHEWRVHSVGAGMSRRLCDRCGHLSIDLTDSFELSADPSPLLSLRR